jgi:hypothetical protein
LQKPVQINGLIEDHVSPLCFRLEPFYGKPASGNTYLVIQPEHHERETHHAHPDRRLADSVGR